MRVQLEPGERVRRERGQLAGERLGPKVPGDDAAIELTHEPGHLGGRSDRDGEPRLDELEELVRQSVHVVEVRGLEQEQADVVALRLLRKALRRDGRHEANTRTRVGQLPQGSEIRHVVTDEHQVEREALVEVVEREDHVLDAPRASREAVMNHAHAIAVERRRRERAQRRRVHDHGRANAEAALVFRGNALANGRHGVRARQRRSAEVAAIALIEPAPAADVLELARGVLVGVEQHPGAVRLTKRERQRPRVGLVRDDQIERAAGKRTARERDRAHVPVVALVPPEL